MNWVNNLALGRKFSSIAVGMCFLMLLPTQSISQAIVQKEVSESLQSWATTVEMCFASQLRASPEALGLPLNPTQTTQMVVFEKIISALPPSPSPDNIKELIASSPDKFCVETVFPSYVKTYATVATQVKVKPTLAPMGSGQIESSSLFVQLAQNHVAYHNRGHYDITLEVANKLTQGGKLNEDFVNLVASASQTPDLFEWFDDRYHAQTQEYDSKNENDKIQKIRISQERYRALIRDYLTRISSSALVNEDEEVILMTGVLSHLVQDLVYHRGMTLRQHAGLSYYKKANPDLPMGDLDKARWLEALEVTTRVMVTVRKRIGENSWARINTWKRSPKFSFSNLTLRTFQKKQDIAVKPLIEYYALIFPYIFATRDDAELDQESCNRKGGIACWDVKEVLSSVLD